MVSTHRLASWEFHCFSTASAAFHKVLRSAYSCGALSLLYFRRSTDEPITPENTNQPYGESPVSTAMGAYFNKKAYTDPTLRRKYSRMGFWVNIRLIRYPDVLGSGRNGAGCC